jgi:hypothetical protein
MLGMKRISPRFSLGSLLLLMVIVGMGIAWWLDHARLKHELINAQTRLAASELLANERELSKRVSQGYGWRQDSKPNQFPTPRAFIDALRTTGDWYPFQDGMESFVRTAIADEAALLLIEPFGDADPEIRWRA